MNGPGRLWTISFGLMVVSFMVLPEIKRNPPVRRGRFGQKIRRSGPAAVDHHGVWPLLLIGLINGIAFTHGGLTWEIVMTSVNFLATLFLILVTIERLSKK